MEEIHVNNINEINFHPVLKDIENFNWFFLLSVRALSDYDVQNILRTKDNIQPGYLCFVQMLDRFNLSTSLQIEKKENFATSKLNIANEMILMGKIMTINLFEILKDSKYFQDLRDLEEFKFLRHIRNGAAHNNKFHFKDRNNKWTLNESEIIEWNNYKIDRNLQDKPVFNNFISFQSIFILGKIFSEKLKNIDLETNKKHQQ